MKGKLSDRQLETKTLKLIFLQATPLKFLLSSCAIVLHFHCKLKQPQPKLTEILGDFEEKFQQRYK